MKIKYTGKIQIRILGVGDINPGDIVEMNEKKAREFLRLPEWEEVKKKKKSEVKDADNDR